MMEVTAVVIALVAVMWFFIMIIDEITYAIYMAAIFARKSAKALFK